MHGRPFAWTALALAALVAAAAGEDAKPATLVYRLDGADGKPAAAEDLKTAVDVVSKRFDAAGWAGVEIAASPTAGQLTVVLPAAYPTLLAQKTEEARSLVERSGTLEFRIQASVKDERRERDRRDEEGAAYVCDVGHAWIAWAEADRGPDALVEIPEGPARAQTTKLKSAGVAETAPEYVKARDAVDQAVRANVFTGADLAKVSVETHWQGGHSVAFELKDDRKAAFADFTEKNVERNVAMILDGKVQSAPIIKSRLPGQGVIVGGGVEGFTEQEARDIVAVFQSGVLRGRLIRVGGDGK